MNLLLGVPRFRGPGRLKAELQTLRRAVRFKGSVRGRFRGILAGGHPVPLTRSMTALCKSLVKAV